MTNFGNQPPAVEDGHVAALRGLERKNTEIAFEKLNAGDLFVGLRQEDLMLIDYALNLKGFELNDFVENFRFNITNESKKEDIYSLSQDIRHAVGDQVKKQKAKELTKIISELYS